MNIIKRYRLTESEDPESLILETDPEYPNTVWLIINDSYDYSFNKDKLIEIVNAIQGENNDG